MFEHAENYKNYKPKLIKNKNKNNNFMHTDHFLSRAAPVISIVLAILFIIACIVSVFYLIQWNVTEITEQAKIVEKLSMFYLAK